MSQTWANCLGDRTNKEQRNEYAHNEADENGRQGALRAPLDCGDLEIPDHRHRYQRTL